MLLIGHEYTQEFEQKYQDKYMLVNKVSEIVFSITTPPWEVSSEQEIDMEVRNYLNRYVYQFNSCWFVVLCFVCVLRCVAAQWKQ